jgi:hypothetical protein
MPVPAPWKEKLLQLDLVGAALMMGLLISYTLALQYGGQTRPWSSSVVIGLLVGFVVLSMVFVAWEIFQGERAMVVPRLVSRFLSLILLHNQLITTIPKFTRRYVLVGSAYMFFFAGAYFNVLYYLPIYFQSIYSSSPVGSGVKMLAFIIPFTIAAIVQGIALSKIGIVPLFWIVGGVLGTIGAGLFYTMDVDTSTGKWIGYQIIVGFTCGCTFQVALANAQVRTTPQDMSQVTAIVNCKFQDDSRLEE